MPPIPHLSLAPTPSPHSEAIVTPCTRLRPSFITPHSVVTVTYISFLFFCLFFSFFLVFWKLKKTVILQFHLTIVTYLNSKKGSNTPRVSCFFSPGRGEWTAKLRQHRDSMFPAWCLDGLSEIWAERQPVSSSSTLASFSYLKPARV